MRIDVDMISFQLQFVSRQKGCKNLYMKKEKLDKCKREKELIPQQPLTTPRYKIYSQKAKKKEKMTKTKHSPGVFWYLKMIVLLSLEFANWPPNLQIIAKSPSMFWSTWKYPSPYSESQVHMLVCFQPTCEPNTCSIQLGKNRKNQKNRRVKVRRRVGLEMPWQMQISKGTKRQQAKIESKQFIGKEHTRSACSDLTLPLRSQTSKHGMSSTGNPARVMVFRCKGWVFSYPSQSTVRSTFSNSVLYDGARELLGSHFSLKSKRNGGDSL